MCTLRRSKPPRQSISLSARIRPGAQGLDGRDRVRGGSHDLLDSFLRIVFMRDGVRTPSRRDICSHSTCVMCSSDTAWLPKGLRQTWSDIHARHAHARGCSRNHAHSVGGAASEAPKAAGCSRDMQITIHKHMLGARVARAARSLPGQTMATSRQASPNPRPTARTASRPSRPTQSASNRRSGSARKPTRSV